MDLRVCIMKSITFGLQQNMKVKILSLLLLCVLSVAQKAKIRSLTDKNLDQFSKDNSYWFIQISNGRCSQCASHEAVLEQLAHMLDGAVKVGKIDSKLIPSFKVQKNPTYMFTRSDEPQNSALYQGALSKKDVAKFCLEQLSAFLKRRAEGKPSSSSGQNSGNSQSSSKSKGGEKSSAGSSSQSSRGSSSVIELTDKVFQEKVLKSNDAWLVQFYSPGCGHCRNFQPEYNKLPKLIGKRVHISRIDGSKNQQFMGKYQVKGFPTVLLFDTQGKEEPVTYNGERTAEAVVDWLKTQSINEQKREVLELTPANYNSECNKNIICLIFILNSKNEKSQLKFLEELIEEQSAKPFRFFYSNRLTQFESDLMIDDRSCPKMVSLWDSINSYRIYNGEIGHQSITEYLKTVLQRKGWIKYHSKFSNALFSNNDL